MKKLGFVVPWYGKSIPGGAEMELRGVTSHLHAAGVELEILTTCVKQFDSDWNVNFHKEGETIEDGIKVIRFPVGTRNAAEFDRVNRILMRGRVPKLPDQEVFFKEMVNSPKLYEYMDQHKDDYSLFVFIPYMFGTTVNGIMVCPSKSVVIPCFHDEAYAHMDILKDVYENVKGLVFNAKPEQDLTRRLFDLSKVNEIVMGIGVDCGLTGDADRFREKFNIKEPFILYAGRKDEGKNVHTLVKYFDEYLKRNPCDMKLVLIGGGNIELPNNEHFVDLGFVDLQDKIDAEAASLLLCQPSKNESFSLVIMESWLGKRPVIVCEECAVTKNFAIESKGGLYFKNYFDFEGCVNYIKDNKDIADQMGINGYEYVKTHFDWDVVTKKYIDFFERCTEGTNG
ncbi:MAG: glycosyltransferase family 4 protein [Clostridiales bacterium]|nr:glycosyltransferase family 4 protein [Clostridiales bacterium]